MEQQLEMFPGEALIPLSAPPAGIEQRDFRGYRRVYRNGEYIGLFPPRERDMNDLRRNEFNANGWREETIA